MLDVNGQLLLQQVPAWSPLPPTGVSGASVFDGPCYLSLPSCDESTFDKGRRKRVSGELGTVE